ncbi:Ppx/GppA phosphatase family protein [Brevundimonas sp. 2R-24]|uniref:Ppx/GppA phosphatase family protein n=1 Tax=Peiella sedimenti TaxID=3061083 RepID=A0ABT8SJ84_9CAUL|nr:Ppx/GppA phosphatase family protein [Caulobacteraceae bacterium XZ-24]
MPDAASAPPGAGPEPSRAPLFGALDLGTNNCRLLIARPTRGGFRVVDAYSRIVRLGEGLTASGRLQPAAMDRAVEALKVCAAKLNRRGVTTFRAVATQACRAAENGPEFIDRVEAETGLRLEIIEPQEEARLSVRGCANLLDRDHSSAIIVDVGGGSTEVSWVQLNPSDGRRYRLAAWRSLPLGVVSLAEAFPEPETPSRAWFEAMVDHVRQALAPPPDLGRMAADFPDGRAHLIGSSGAVTSLAGLHLGLLRYDRNKVDGLWLTREDCTATAERLLGMNLKERSAEPCIGPDRADLVLAGAAILEALQADWPCPRVRVADRGLREGLLLSQMYKRRGR